MARASVRIETLGKRGEHFVFGVPRVNPEAIKNLHRGLKALGFEGYFRFRIKLGQLQISRLPRNGVIKYGTWKALNNGKALPIHGTFGK